MSSVPPNSTYVGNAVCGYPLGWACRAWEPGARPGKPAPILAPEWNFLVLGGLESEPSLVLVLLFAARTRRQPRLLSTRPPRVRKASSSRLHSAWGWPGPPGPGPAASSCASTHGLQQSHRSGRPGWRAACLCLGKRRQGSQLP